MDKETAGRVNQGMAWTASIATVLLVVLIFWHTGVAEQRDMWQQRAENRAQNHYNHLMPQLAKSMCGIEDITRIGTEQQRGCFVGARLKAAQETSYDRDRALANR